MLQARPAESEAKLSYAALADLVGDVFDETAAALPAVQERALAAALLRAEADATADPRTTATALGSVLAALAADEPLLVAIDEVQWLDPASAQALAFAATRLPSDRFAGRELRALLGELRRWLLAPLLFAAFALRLLLGAVPLHQRRPTRSASFASRRPPASSCGS